MCSGFNSTCGSVYTQPGEAQLWSDHWDGEHGELLLQWIIHQGVVILPNLWSKRSLHCLDSFSTGWFMWGQHLVQSFVDTAKHMCYISHMCHIVTSQAKHPVVSHMSMLLRRPLLLPFRSGQFTSPPKLHLVKAFTVWTFSCRNILSMSTKRHEVILFFLSLAVVHFTLLVVTICVWRFWSVKSTKSLECSPTVSLTQTQTSFSLQYSRNFPFALTVFQLMRQDPLRYFEGSSTTSSTWTGCSGPHTLLRHCASASPQTLCPSRTLPSCLIRARGHTPA